MSVKRRQHGQVSILDIGGELNDDRSTRELDRALNDEVARGTRRLLLNVSECSSMLSAALGVILKAKKALEVIGGEVQLCGLRRPKFVFLAPWLHETETEAIAAFGPVGSED